MKEKLCIFCKHFKWTRQLWMRGTMGAISDYGGIGECAKDHFDKLRAATKKPATESEYRKLILQGQSCADYKQVKI